MSNGGIVKLVPLAKLRRDPAMQLRASRDEEAIAGMIAALKRGEKLPAVDAVHEEATDTVWVTDGFHRVEAMEQARCPDAECRITPGTRDDALWAAAGANKANLAIRRTNADKERAVRAALHLRSAVGDERIAEHVGVDKKTVWKYRSEMEAAGELPQLSHRLGKDGKPHPTKKSPKSDDQAAKSDGQKGKEDENATGASEPREESDKSTPTTGATEEIVKSNAAPTDAPLQSPIEDEEEQCEDRIAQFIIGIADDLGHLIDQELRGRVTSGHLDLAKKTIFDEVEKSIRDVVDDLLKKWRKKGKGGSNGAREQATT